ncbi:MAG: hypothetical protein SPK17_10285 [Treponema sp.]|nr:hypothetical protein [Treponema sp.]
MAWTIKYHPIAKEELAKLDGSVRKACHALTPSDLSEEILEALISLCATSAGNHKQCDKTI